MMMEAWALTTPPTKPPRSRYLSLHTPERVQARHRMKIAGVMALKPRLKQSQKALKVTMPRGR